MTTLPLASVYTHALQGHPARSGTDDLAPAAARRPRPGWRAPARRPGRAWRTVVGPTLDIGCGPGRMAEALAPARPRRARHRRRARGGAPDPRPRGPGPAAQRLRPAAGRGPLEHRAARRRQHRHRGRPGRPAGARARAGGPRRPRRRRRGPVGRRAWSPATSGSRPPTAAAGCFPWTLVGADASRPSPQAAGLGRGDRAPDGDRGWAVVEARP